MFSGVTKFGEQTVALAVGPRIHFAPDNHADYGVRAVVTLVFPKGKSKAFGNGNLLVFRFWMFDFGFHPQSKTA